MKALRPDEVAERWQCSKKLVYRLIQEGKLPAYRFGGRLLRLKLEDVERYEACNRSLGPSSLGGTFMQLGENAAKPVESRSAPKIVRLPNPRYGALPNNTRYPNGHKS